MPDHTTKFPVVQEIIELPLTILTRNSISENSLKKLKTNLHNQSFKLFSH
jgi:hypothetical protein